MIQYIHNIFRVLGLLQKITAFTNRSQTYAGYQNLLHVFQQPSELLLRLFFNLLFHNFMLYPDHILLGSFHIRHSSCIYFEIAIQINYTQMR